MPVGGGVPTPVGELEGVAYWEIPDGSVLTPDLTLVTADSLKESGVWQPLENRSPLAYGLDAAGQAARGDWRGAASTVADEYRRRRGYVDAFVRTLPVGAQVAFEMPLDPSMYVGVGAVRRAGTAAGKFLPRVIGQRAGRAVETALTHPRSPIGAAVEGVSERPFSVAGAKDMAAFTAGGALASEGASRLGLDDQYSMFLAPLVGGSSLLVLRRAFQQAVRGLKAADLEGFDFVRDDEGQAVGMRNGPDTIMPSPDGGFDLYRNGQKVGNAADLEGLVLGVRAQRRNEPDGGDRAMPGMGIEPPERDTRRATRTGSLMSATSTRLTGSGLRSGAASPTRSRPRRKARGTRSRTRGSATGMSSTRSGCRATRIVGPRAAGARSFGAASTVA